MAIYYLIKQPDRVIEKSSKTWLVKKTNNNIESKGPSIKKKYLSHANANDKWDSNSNSKTVIEGLAAAPHTYINRTISIIVPEAGKRYPVKVKWEGHNYFFSVSFTNNFIDFLNKTNAKFDLDSGSIIGPDESKTYILPGHPDKFLEKTGKTPPPWIINIHKNIFGIPAGNLIVDPEGVMPKEYSWTTHDFMQPQIKNFPESIDNYGRSLACHFYLFDFDDEKKVINFHKSIIFVSEDDVLGKQTSMFHELFHVVEDCFIQESVVKEIDNAYHAALEGNGAFPNALSVKRGEFMAYAAEYFARNPPAVAKLLRSRNPTVYNLLKKITGLDPASKNNIGY